MGDSISKDGKSVIIVLTVVAVTILVGFFVLLIISLSSPSPSVTNEVIINSEEEAEPGEPASAAVRKEMTFEFTDGQMHTETMTAKGNMLTVLDEEDGFVAYMDYGRNILMIKDTRSDVCYFSSLENFADMNMDDMDNVKPFYFMRWTADGIPDSNDPRFDVYRFNQSSPIPSAYVIHTNSMEVATECKQAESYWIRPMSHLQAKKRSLFLGFLVTIIGNIISGVVVAAIIN